MHDLAGLLKGTRVLTLQNVNLSNLTTIRSFDAGSLTARAWETLRAAVQGVKDSRAAAPVQHGGGVTTPSLAPWGNQDLPRMRRGVERC